MKTHSEEIIILDFTVTPKPFETTRGKWLFATVLHSRKQTHLLSTQTNKIENECELAVPLRLGIQRMKPVTQNK